MPGIGIGANIAFGNVAPGGGIPGQLAAGSGSFLFTGQAAGVRKASITAAANGAFTFSGQAATLIAQRILAAGQGDFSFSGQAVSLTKAAPGAFVTSAESGAFVFSGDTMTPLRDFKTPADAGAFSFSGQAASPIVGRKTAAASGSFTFDGQAATLTKSSSSITWNNSDKGPDITLSGGDLTATRSANTGGDWNGVRASGAGHSSGKFYWEYVSATSVTLSWPGFGNASALLTSNPSGANDLVFWETNGNTGAASGGAAAASWTLGDTLCFAVDFTAKLVWLKVNGGNWNNNGSANPATGVGGYDFSAIGAGPYFPGVWMFATTAAFTANFGGSAFTYTPPSGFGNP